MARHLVARRRRGAAALFTAAAVAVGAGGSGAAVSAADPSTADDDPFALLAAAPAVGDSVGIAVRAGDPALYVVSRTGGIVAVDVGDGSATAVADLSDLVETGSGEQGLLGLAFSPDGTLAYLNYTAAGSGDTVIAELPVVDGEDGTVGLDRTSMREVLSIEQPYRNHNGGHLFFGRDGSLYIPTGDGGAGGDPERYAQALDSLLGKLLRIDPTPAGDGSPYTIPPDNPYRGVDGALDEIWAIGLRNPWRVAVDPLSGDLWIADVGQSSVEEINLAPATDDGTAGRGANFGWSALEGDRPFNTDVELFTGERIDPVFTYAHSDGNCSVSGGVRVREAAAPQLEGAVVFADYCSARVFVLAVEGHGAAAVVDQEPAVHHGPPSPTSVAQGPDGAVYITAAGGVYRFTPQG